MLPLSVLVDRIREQVPEFANVTGVAELVAAKGIAQRRPACYIAPGQETADRDAMIGRASQRVRETFGIWIAVANGASATGAAAQEQLGTLAAAARAALVGWQPDAEHTPIELVSAGPVQWDDDQTLFWPELYQTEYYLETQNG